MRPDAEAYSGFFDLVRSEGCRTQPIDTFSAASLRDFVVAALPDNRRACDSTLAWREVHARDAGKVLKSGRLPRPVTSVLYDVNDSELDAMG